MEKPGQTRPSGTKSAAYRIAKAKRAPYKWTVTEVSTNKSVHFGHRDYQDYTMHGDPQRQKNYVSRHQKRENWEASGIMTAGFWSRWLLWAHPDIETARRAIERRFAVKVHMA